LRVVIIAGPNRDAAAIVDRPLLAGSAETCDLHVTDPTVSRRHLLLQPGDSGVRVRDQDSRNGTWLGTARIHDADLPPGSEVRIGDTVLRVELVDAAAEGPRAGAARAKPARAEFGRFIGSAPILAPLYDLLERAAGSDTTVLLEGESGTGKELLAEAIHTQSIRRAAPFVVVDCGSVPATLIESELFGHERGAFTGADRARVGAFETAHRGTLFLDEIGELPLPMQTRLLRALDKRQIRRVGGSAPLDVDVRIVAATNRNLDREVEEGRFRLDLYHRIAVLSLRVPPLRERASDVELLARSFLRALGGDESMLTRDVLLRLTTQRWPGNVRELRNHVERLVLLGRAGAEAAASAPSWRGDASSTRAPADPLAAATSGLPYRSARALAIRAFTDAYTRDMLVRHGGNVSRAARASGVARRWFQSLKARDPEE
jgi:DNA-binding NtrC family response regulator